MNRFSRGLVVRFAVLVGLCSVGIFGIASAGAAGQTTTNPPQTQTLTTDVLAGGMHFAHTYTITVNCNGTFTGTGSTNGGAQTETITGTISGGKITATAMYGGGSTYSYTFTATVDSSGAFTGTNNGTDSTGQTFDVSGTGATVPTCAPPCDKPGYGYGDKNHTHCGPPGRRHHHHHHHEGAGRHH